MTKEVKRNKEAFETYRVLFGRLRRALNSRFFLEAVFIEFAILEDRSAALLRHLCNKSDDKAKISTKINKLLNLQRTNKHPSLVKNFNGDFFCDILAWKDRRNQLIHALVRKSPDELEWEACALDGYDLVRNLSDRTRSIKRQVERKAFLQSSKQKERI